MNAGERACGSQSRSPTRSTPGHGAARRRSGSGLRMPQDPRCPRRRRAQDRSGPVGAAVAGHTTPFCAGPAVHPWTHRFHFDPSCWGISRRSIGRRCALLAAQPRLRNLAGDPQDWAEKVAGSENWVARLAHLPVVTSGPLCPLTLTFIFYFGHGTRRTLIFPQIRETTTTSPNPTRPSKMLITFEKGYRNSDFPHFERRK